MASKTNNQHLYDVSFGSSSTFLQFSQKCFRILKGTSREVSFNTVQEVIKVISVLVSDKGINFDLCTLSSYPHIFIQYENIKQMSREERKRRKKVNIPMPSLKKGRNSQGTMRFDLDELKVYFDIVNDVNERNYRVIGLNFEDDISQDDISQDDISIIPNELYTQPVNSALLQPKKQPVEDIYKNFSENPFVNEPRATFTIKYET
jgi:hypothetical protein